MSMAPSTSLMDWSSYKMASRRDGQNSTSTDGGESPGCASSPSACAGDNSPSGGSPGDEDNGSSTDTQSSSSSSSSTSSTHSTTISVTTSVSKTVTTISTTVTTSKTSTTVTSTSSAASTIRPAVTSSDNTQTVQFAPGSSSSVTSSPLSPPPIPTTDVPSNSISSSSSVVSLTLLTEPLGLSSVSAEPTITFPANSDAASSSSTSSPPNLPAIIGGIIGGVIALLLCCAFCYCYRKRPKRLSTTVSESEEHLAPLGHVSRPSQSSFSTPNFHLMVKTPPPIRPKVSIQTQLASTSLVTQPNATSAITPLSEFRLYSDTMSFRSPVLEQAASPVPSELDSTAYHTAELDPEPRAI